MSDVKFNETFEEIFPNGLDYSDVGQGGICSLNVEQIQFVVESATSHDQMVDRIRVLEEALKGLLDSPHTKLSKGALLEVSEVDIDSAIKALGGEE